jgi:hypothetical protein
MRFSALPRSETNSTSAPNELGAVSAFRRQAGL